MKFKLFPDEDRHWYLFCSLALIVIAVLLLKVDKNLPRAFSVAGGVINLAGAYWIAAGVVLRATDISKLDHTSLGGGLTYVGIDPVKAIIPNMLRVQSTRARLGLIYVFVGSCNQFIGAYLS